jgi:hypothetical protein
MGIEGFEVAMHLEGKRLKKQQITSAALLRQRRQMVIIA